MDLVLQVKDQANKTPTSENGDSVLMITPAIGEGYWRFRVQVSPNQAIVGFPKFFSLAIGFEVEDDWNTNLPSSGKAEGILNHIWVNRGEGNDGDEFRQRCLEAIKMIQEAQVASMATRTDIQ
jgi:hypothetical protein